MDIDFSEKLKGFEDIWRRVQQQKGPKSPAAPAPKPTQAKGRSRANRFDPGRR